MKYIVALTVAGLRLMPAVSSMAQEAQEEGILKAKPEVKELTLTGKISKEVKTVGEETKVAYFLTDADGSKISLPKPKPPKAKEGAVEVPVAINLDEFVGQQVNLIGKGTEIESKGKKDINIKEITSIKKVEGKAAADVGAGKGSEGL